MASQPVEQHEDRPNAGPIQSWRALFKCPPKPFDGVGIEPRCTAHVAVTQNGPNARSKFLTAPPPQRQFKARFRTFEQRRRKIGESQVTQELLLS